MIAGLRHSFAIVNCCYVRFATSDRSPTAGPADKQDLLSLMLRVAASVPKS